MEELQSTRPQPYIPEDIVRIVTGFAYNEYEEINKLMNTCSDLKNTCEPIKKMIHLCRYNGLWATEKFEKMTKIEKKFIPEWSEVYKNHENGKKTFIKMNWEESFVTSLLFYRFH
jgi:hypothetical protein